MEEGVFEFSGLSEPVRRVEAETLGYVLYLLHGTSRTRLSLEAVKAWVRVAIRLDQLLVVFDQNGLPVGYASWAWVTARTAARLRKSAGVPFVEDWNDGTHLLLVDLVAPFGGLPLLLSELEKVFKLRANRVHYISRRRRGVKRHNLKRSN